MDDASGSCSNAKWFFGMPRGSTDRWHSVSWARLACETGDADVADSCPKSLPDEEKYASLLSRVEDLQTLFAEIAAYNIPPTLFHGDYNVDNIAGIPNESGVLHFIDWSNAAIGHPFVDFVRFYYLDDYGSDDERGCAKAQYLRSWERCETRENIRRAVDMAYLVMLCENLLVLRSIFESAGRHAREILLTLFKERLSSILDVLIKNCHFSPLEDSYGSDAVSRVIICRGNGRVVLAKQENEILSLPLVNAFRITEHAARDRQADGHGLRVMIRSQLGIDTRRMRSFWLHPESETDRTRCALVFQSLDTDNQIPRGYQWVDSHSVEGFSDCSRRERSMVEAFFRNSTDLRGSREHAVAIIRLAV